MVPFIDLDALDTDDIIRQMGNKLLEVFSTAYDVTWDMDIQKKNIESFLASEKTTFGVGSEIRRAFVYHFCIHLYLVTQNRIQKLLNLDEAEDLISKYGLPKIQED